MKQNTDETTTGKTASPDKTELGATVSTKVAGLLSAIEKEPVPDRLMELALQLQKALNEKQGLPD